MHAGVDVHSLSNPGGSVSQSSPDKRSAVSRQATLGYGASAPDRFRPASHPMTLYSSVPASFKKHQIVLATYGTFRKQQFCTVCCKKANKHSGRMSHTGHGSAIRRRSACAAKAGLPVSDRRRGPGSARRKDSGHFLSAASFGRNAATANSSCIVHGLVIVFG